MFADKIGESSSTTGTGTFTLTGTYGSFRTWRSGFSTGAVAFYLATNDTGTIWEIGYGTLTWAASDTLSRTLITSSSGALISWATVPYRVFNVPTGVAMAHLIAGGKATSRPAWLQRGGRWLDDSDSGAWSTGYAIEKQYTGSVDVELGRVESATIYTPSPRNRWVDNGAANLTMTVNHIGQVIEFNTTASARTFTLLAGATAGIGHGFTCWVMPYGTSKTNGVVLTPNGSEVIDRNAAAATVTVPPNRLSRLTWDGGRSQWRTDLESNARTHAYSKGTLYGLGLSTAGSSATFGVAAGYCVDSTGVSNMELTTAYAKTTSAWAVGSAAGGLDTGAIANSTWYHVYIIERVDPAVVDVLFSLSATAPTLPTNYTLSRRIGAIQTNGSAQWVSFKQLGDNFYRLNILDATLGGGTTVATLTTFSVPTGIVVEPFTSVQSASSNNNTGGIQYAPASDATLLFYVSFQYTGAVSGTRSVNNIIGPPTNTSAQFYVAQPNGGGETEYIYTYGWRDRRGQDG